MTIKDILAQTSLTGVLLVILFYVFWNFLKSHIEESVKISFQSEIEKLKYHLENQKYIFDKKYEACSELNQIVERYNPEKHHPDMDWGEAMIDISDNFDRISQNIKSFFSSYRLILSNDLESLLEKCKGTCEDGSFLGNDSSVWAQRNEMAESVYTDLQAAVKLSRNEILDELNP